MTPSEAVVMDLLMERGYTREQAARALVALTLPEPTAHELLRERDWESRYGPLQAAELHCEAERLGYLPKP